LLLVSFDATLRICLWLQRRGESSRVVSYASQDQVLAKYEQQQSQDEDHGDGSKNGDHSSGSFVTYGRWSKSKTSLKVSTQASNEACGPKTCCRKTTGRCHPNTHKKTFQGTTAASHVLDMLRLYGETHTRAVFGNLHRSDIDGGPAMGF
jgi:hypothetical protein